MCVDASPACSAIECSTTATVANERSPGQLAQSTHVDYEIRNGYLLLCDLSIPPLRLTNTDLDLLTDNVDYLTHWTYLYVYIYLSDAYRRLSMLHSSVLNCFSIHNTPLSSSTPLRENRYYLSQDVIACLLFILNASYRYVPTRCLYKPA